MKVILTMAISANGMIATKDGSEDFLSHDNWERFVNLANRIGCFIWGRKTYDAVSKWEGDFLDDVKGLKKVVISHSPAKLVEGFISANSPEDALKKLEANGFNQAIITGGAAINSEFAKRDLIDEVIFDVNPSILGEGIPVFSPTDFLTNLELVSSEKIAGDIVELRYKVTR